MSNTIEVEATTEPQAQTMAIERRSEAPAPAPAITAAQAKVDAIASLTMKAYDNASTLKLSPEEIAGLQADFPDEAFKPGAAGKENLIYIEHAFLRDRLNQVIGLGQWAIVPRNRWAEPFKTKPNRDNPEGKEGSRVYVEAMLLIRGAFVGEAVGEMEYYPHNHAQNYGDAVEGAKTAAFRRCAKELGVGLQAWKKDWCDGWWARRRGSKRPQDEKGHTNTPPPAPKPAQAPPASAAPPQKPTCAKEVTRNWMIRELGGDEPGGGDVAIEYFRALEKPSVIMPNEGLRDVPLEWVPITRDELKLLNAAISNFVGTSKAVHPYLPHPLPEEEKQKRAAKAAAAKPAPAPAKPVEVPRDANCDPNSPSAPWRSFPVPFGRDAGVKLAELDKKVLFGWWANYKVETEYNGRAKKPETIAKDRKFRQMLDESGKHYEFGKPREEPENTPYNQRAPSEITDRESGPSEPQDGPEEADDVPF